MKDIINMRTSRTRMFFLFIVDVFTIILNSYLALIIRHELHYSWIPQTYIDSIKSYMLINIITTILLFVVMKLYRSVWSFASVHEFVLVFGACMFTILTYSWLIDSLIRMKCPSLSLLISFSLKSILLDIKMATPACFLGPFAWNIFFHPFILR